MDKEAMLREIREAADMYDLLPVGDIPSLQPTGVPQHTPVRPGWSQQ